MFHPRPLHILIHNRKVTHGMTMLHKFLKVQSDTLLDQVLSRLLSNYYNMDYMFMLIVDIIIRHINSNGYLTPPPPPHTHIDTSHFLSTQVNSYLTF